MEDVIRTRTSPVKVVYLAGTGRSGTTLLGNAIGSIPGCLSVGEVKYGIKRGLSEDGFCGCRLPVRECPVWVAALERTFGGVPTREEARDLDARLHRAVRTRSVPVWLRESLSDERAELVSVMGRLTAALATTSGARVIIDSSKLPAYAALLARHSELDVSFLNVVRDPRAVAFSWLRENASEQIAGFEEEMEKFSPGKSSAMWVESSTSTELLARRARRAALEVRYEDFVTDPKETLIRIADHAEITGLPSDWADHVVQADGLHLAANHAIAGNPNRVRTGPVRLRLDDEWRTGLSPRDHRIVSVLTAPRRRTHGY